MVKNKMHGRFQKTINDLVVTGWYEGYPLSTEVSRGEGKIRLHGVDQAKDLVYALQQMIADYESP